MSPSMVERDQHASSTFLVCGIRQMTAGLLTLLTALWMTRPFDSSHLVLDPNSTAGLRWDSIHFGSIALKGYEYEQQLAFMPLLPLTLRLTGEGGVIFRRLIGRFFTIKPPSELGWVDVSPIQGGLISSGLVILSGYMLYKLTRLTTGSHRFASTACAFYAFSPHPAASVAPYTEPLYAALTFTGFYFSLKRRWLFASVFLALATATRAMGIFNIGILGWHILFGSSIPSQSDLTPRRLARRCLVALPCCFIAVAPFIALQAYAYASFCLDSNTHRPWCDQKLPMVYSFVQAEYWNMGFLNYWSLAQIPNFILAAPVILVSVFPTIAYFRCILSESSADLPATKTALLPFQIHHAFMTLLLIFGSHTQIALRLAMTDAVVWWNVTSVAFDWSTWYSVKAVLNTVQKPVLEVDAQAQIKAVGEASLARSRVRMTLAGKLWTGWVVTWGAASLALWAGHYPPA